MNSGKKSIIGFVCVMLCCILVIGITIGLLSSVDNTVTAGSTADTTDTTDSTKDTTEEPPEVEPELELEWGYKFKYVNGFIDGTPIGQIAYKSAKNTFKLDEVKLTVSFGAFYGGEYIHEYINIPQFDIYFSDPSDYSYIPKNIFSIKTVEEQFLSEKYNVRWMEDESKAWDYHYEFSHTEEITIPKELFTENEGFIYIAICGINVAENSHYVDYVKLGATSIKYQQQGADEVILLKPCESEWYY